MLQGQGDPLSYLGLRPLLHLQRKGHVVENVHVGPDRESLEHHTQPPVLRRDVDIFVLDGHRLSAQIDGAGGEVLEAGDHAQRGGLAAAGGAQEGKALALLYLQIKAVHGRDGAQRLGGKRLGDIFQYDLIHGFSSPFCPL